MSFLFDKLFQKQNPELASEMAKRGLIFDRIKHRWVKNPVNRAQPKTAPKVSHSEIAGPKIPGMEGPFSYKTGNSYYYSPKEGKYYDAKSDVFMPTGFDPHTGQYSDVTAIDLQRKKEVATDTFEQLGGRLFGSMVGAKNLVSLSEGNGGIQFNIGKGAKNGINKVRISLNNNDTYDIEFLRVHGTKVTPKEKVSDVYAEDLARVFENNTGLFTAPKWKRGDKVQIPHRGKMTTGTIVRDDGGDYYKGEKVGSAFYVVDVGEYASVKVPTKDVRG